MKFHTEKRPGFTVIGVCEEEAELRGFQDEKKFQPIHLRDKVTRLFFEYEPGALHPDVLALICFCAFYPFLKRRVTFPMPVSLKAKQLFERFNLLNGNAGTPSGPVEVMNGSIDQEAYSGQAGNTVMAFGGGMDSTALSLVMPPTTLINQSDHFPRQSAMLQLMDRITSLVPGHEAHAPVVNIRSCIREWQYSGWVCCYLAPLLYAKDCNASAIYSGHQLGSRYMSWGVEKFQPPLTRSQIARVIDSYCQFRDWHVLFEAFGIRLLSPLAGLTGLAISKMVYAYGLHNEVLYCQLDQGRPCHQCPKCFTKNLELEYWQYRQCGKMFDPDYWQGYRELVTERRFLDALNLYFYALANITAHVPHTNKPGAIQALLDREWPRFDWVDKQYPNARQDFSSARDGCVFEKLADQGIMDMTATDIQRLQGYDRNHYTRF